MSKDLRKVEKPESLSEKKPEPNPPVKKETPSFGMPLGAKKALEVTLGQELAVVLSQKAFTQLFGFAYATDVEVSLLGIVERQGGVFKVSEFFLVEQSGSSARTETDSDALGELIEKLMIDGRKDDAKKIRCWAHSHPGMDVFWSHTDDQNCRRLSSDWLVSIVVSDNFKIRCRVDVALPVPFSLDNVPVFCEPLIDPAIVSQCAAEVKEKIRTLPVFSLGTITDELREREKKADRSKDPGVELIEYCEECGSWHEDDKCPLRFLSGYEMAHRESLMTAEDELWADDGYAI